MLYQKFSGCGTCSGRDTEIHTTVVEHSDPADYHYDTSIDDRFKTYKHDGGGTNALAMPHGPRELIVLEETKRRTAKNNSLPHSISEKAFTNCKLTTWQRVEPTCNDGGWSDVSRGTTKTTGTVRIV